MAWTGTPGRQPRESLNYKKKKPDNKQTHFKLKMQTFPIKIHSGNSANEKCLTILPFHFTGNHEIVVPPPPPPPPPPRDGLRLLPGGGGTTGAGPTTGRDLPALLTAKATFSNCTSYKEICARGFFAPAASGLSLFIRSRVAKPSAGNIYKPNFLLRHIKTEAKSLLQVVRASPAE